MEKQKEIINIENNTEKIDFDSLRQQVELIGKEEMAKKERGEHYDSHFDFIELDKLIEEDLIIFDKFLKKTLSSQEFANYKISGSINDPRLSFKAYIGNQLQRLDNLKWFDRDLYESWKKTLGDVE